MPVDVPAAGYNWPWRADVAIGIVSLMLAALLVRGVRLSRWRFTLGHMVKGDSKPATPADEGRVRYFAESIERASAWLPFPIKCLPKAVALQWRLRVLGIPSRLVVAVHRTDRASAHSFHAWVEHGGTVVIGQCDVQSYQAVLTLSQGSPAAINGTP